MREIVVDIETTGLDPKKGDKIIEIACLELINHIPTDQYFHEYVNPKGKEISEGAFKVHGISNDFLNEKLIFDEVADNFLEFIGESPVLAHNASFDVGFLNHELSLDNKKIITDDKVIDTLAIARAKHPGMPNNLDALCKRYNISEQKRGLHDAKSDCELLAQVYIELIGGRQSNFQLHDDDSSKSLLEDTVTRVLRERRPSQKVTDEELKRHREFTENFVDKALWSGKD